MYRGFTYYWRSFLTYVITKQSLIVPNPLRGLTHKSIGFVHNNTPHLEQAGYSIKPFLNWEDKHFRNWIEI